MLLFIIFDEIGISICDIKDEFCFRMLLPTLSTVTHVPYHCQCDDIRPFADLYLCIILKFILSCQEIVTVGSTAASYYNIHNQKLYQACIASS